jgi:hypothetical protein
MATGIRPGFPVGGDGYTADVKSGGEHLRLFAEVYSLGFLAVVYDVNRKTKVSANDADNLDDVKARAESVAAGYLRYRGAGNLPEVAWSLNAQSRAATIESGVPNSCQIRLIWCQSKCGTTHFSFSLHKNAELLRWLFARR